MSSLTGKVEVDTELNASAELFYDMFCNKLHQASNACADVVQECSLQEGDWGKEGSIVYWNCVIDGETKVAKEIIESIDPKDKSISYRVIEGDLLKEYKSFMFKVQVTPKSQGQGSIVRYSMEYEKLHEGIPAPETLLKPAVQLCKVLDSYLLQENQNKLNP